MLSRRLFLRNSALIGCSAAAHPLMSSMAFATAPGDKRLVVIILRGAMDGMDAFQPYGDPNLRKFRRTLSLGPEKGATDLDGFFALHPALEPLLPLWKAGELGFAPAVSPPYRGKRSHFDGQAVLEAGTGLDNEVFQQRDGWLNRLLQNMPDARSETAYVVGIEHMRILSGKADVTSWAPDAELRVSEATQQLLRHVYENDPLFHAASEEAMELAAADISGGSEKKGRIGDARALARFTAQRLNDDTRIATFSLSGWDTHARQPNILSQAFEGLAEAITTLRDELGGNWSNTVVMAMTEFGRTVRENGTGGTDHGTGGTLLVAGGAVKGGQVMGRWPGLAEGDLFAWRDLMPVADIRSYAAWALRDMFGTSREILEEAVFPGIDMSERHRILA